MKHRMPAWHKLTAALLSALLVFDLAYPATPALALEPEPTAAVVGQEQAADPSGAQIEVDEGADQEGTDQAGTDAQTASQASAGTDSATPTAKGTDETISVASADAEHLSTAPENGAATTTAKTNNAQPAATPAEQVTVTVEVIGPDTAGSAYDWISPAAVSADKGASAWTVLKSAFDQAGITYDAPESSYGVYINTISSPLSGEAYGWDAATGKFWQFFVNGAASNVGVSAYTLADGDTITLSYSAWGASDATKTSSSATYDDLQTEVTDLPSDWSQSEDKDNVTNASTPTTQTSVNWKTRIGGGATVSEPLIVGGKVYLAVGQNPSWSSVKSDYAGKLVRIDPSSGKVEATGDLARDLDYTVRPLYQGGVIYVPLQGGVVQAFNASTLKTRWISAGTTTTDQSSCSLRLDKGTLYVGTASYGANYTFGSGALAALDAATGRTSWSAANASAGYYFTAPIRIGDTVYIGDTAGIMHAFDAASGAEKGTLALGSAINADPVAYQGSLLVITRDGVLHRLTVNADGTLTAAGKLQALGGAKAAPTVVGSTAIAAGLSTDGKTGALVLIDLGTMQVTHTVTKAAGLAFALNTFATAPLVSVQSDGTWCYFARNTAENPDSTYTTYASGGDLYSYRLGDAEAHLLYAPDGTVAQYCDSPVIADAAGNLYYLNDSGYLVQLKARVKKNDTPPTDPSNNKPGTNPSSPAKPATKPSAPTGTATAKPGSAAAAPRAAFTPLATALAATSQQGTATKASASTSGAEAAATTDTETSAAGIDITAAESAADEAATRYIPLWPIIGIVCGLGLLIWLFASRRRKDEEDA